jgi:hypothetical protein
MINLYNKQNSNMTTLLPVTDFVSENSNISSNVLHLLYDNSYFNNFFEYGIKNILFNAPLKINSQFSEEINYQNSNIQNFFNILYYYISENENNKVLYNEIWKGEFVIIGQLIKKIVGNIDFPDLSCNEEENEYINIMCDINKDLVISESNIIFGEIPNKDENDIIFYDLNKTASNFSLSQKMLDMFEKLHLTKSNLFLYLSFISFALCSASGSRSIAHT